MSLTIVVADDQELIRKGLAALLGYESDFDVLDCGSVRRVLQLVARQLPQVVILDTTLSGVDVIDTTKHIKSLSPGTRVVVLSSYLDEIFVRTLIEAGIGGYVLKSDPACDLIEAIRAGNVRDVYLSHEVAAIVRREDASPINFGSFRRRTPGQSTAHHACQAGSCFAVGASHGAGEVAATQKATMVCRISRTQAPGW
jgi:NarL family two-component system response regulator LiaR